MALKHYKPTTPTRRHLVLVDRSELWPGKPRKDLVEKIYSKGGRNNYGNVTVGSRGGGHKRKYRKIDFLRNKIGIEGIVERLEYDPNRTAFIALIKYTDDEYSYIIAPQRIKAGDKIISGENAEIRPGNALPLSSIPVGTIIHNIEMKPGKGAQIARSAGNYAQLTGKDSGYCLLKLRSGSVIMIRSQCMATIGSVSNPDQQNISLGKAGRNRWKGRRPKVRGVAMNPVDHPHGGGEGKTSGGRHPVSPKGNPTKGKKTRNNKRTEKYIVKKRK